MDQAVNVLFTVQHLELHIIGSAEVEIPGTNTIVGLYADGMTWQELIDDCLQACREAYGWNGKPIPKFLLEFKIKD